MSFSIPDDPRISALGEDPERIECPPYSEGGCGGGGWLQELHEEVRCPLCSGLGDIPNPQLCKVTDARMTDLAKSRE